MTSNGNAAGAEQEAFATLYEHHHQALYRYCRSIVRHEHDAEDALQSTMTRAYAALQGETRDFDLRPWLFRIAHNESVSILRRRRPVVELDTQIAAAGAVDERIEARETLRLLRQDLAGLPGRQRAALILREFYGLRPAEIAGMLETTPSAVNQAILDARRALSKCDEGRATPCFDVQRALSDGDGRVMRGRGLRAHLRSCASCRRFKADLGRRPSELAALAPSLPAGAGALLAALHGSASAGAGAIAGRLLAKVAISAVVVTAAATGAHSLHRATRTSRPAHAAPAAPAAVASPGAVAGTPTPQGASAPAPASRRTAPARPAPGQAHPRAPVKKRHAPTPAPTATAPRAARQTATGTPAPPAEKQSEHATGRATAPGQVRKQSEPATGKATAPGQVKKQSEPATGKATAPGQVKKQSEAATGEATAPGNVKTPGGGSGQTTAPGQVKKQIDPAQTVAPETPPPSAPGNSGDAPGHSPDGPHGRS